MEEHEPDQKGRARVHSKRASVRVGAISGPLEFLKKKSRVDNTRTTAGRVQGTSGSNELLRACGHERTHSASTSAPTEPTEALAESKDKRAAMASSSSDAERVTAPKRREAPEPRWFGEPLEDMKTASDMGFTVPLVLRALRQALYAQDVFETPGCFQHTHRCNQKAKTALRERLSGGEDPFVVCKPSIPVELLTSLLIGWLHELPGGLWGEESASGWPLIACTSPNRRKGAPGKGRTNLMQLMAKTLGGAEDTSTDKVTRVGPLLHALEPRRREVRVAPFAQATPTSHSSRQPHTSISNRYCSGCSRCWTWRSSIKSTREWATLSSLR